MAVSSAITAVPELHSHPARRASLGEGLWVSRLLPSRQQRMVGAWCFADHFGPSLIPPGEKAMDVAPHPHTGLQTVTWLLDGELLHNDSLDCRSTVRPGELNLMTAGHGISHSEETPPEHSNSLHGVQLWLALPDNLRNCEPSFQHHRKLPRLDENGSQLQVFIGSLGELHSPAQVFSPVVAAEIGLQAGAGIKLPLQADWEYALIVVEGQLQVTGTQQPLGTEALHYFAPGAQQLDLSCGQPARAILIGGTPFPEAIVMWWNFVGRSAEDITRARADWQAGTRFGTVTAYQGERLPAPELSGRPRASRQMLPSPALITKPGRE